MSSGLEFVIAALGLVLGIVMGITLGMLMGDVAQICFGMWLTAVSFLLLRRVEKEHLGDRWPF